jgi:hypothetical protein
LVTAAGPCSVLSCPRTAFATQLSCCLRLLLVLLLAISASARPCIRPGHCCYCCSHHHHRPPNLLQHAAKLTAATACCKMPPPAHCRCDTRQTGPPWSSTLNARSMLQPRSGLGHRLRASAARAHSS